MTSHRLPWPLAPDGNTVFCLKHRVRLFVWVVNCSFHLKRWGPHGASFTSFLFSHILHLRPAFQSSQILLLDEFCLGCRFGKKIACCASNCNPEQEGFRRNDPYTGGTWAAPHPGGEPLRARAQVRICRTGAGATCYCGHSTDVKWITNHQKSCSPVKQPSVSEGGP